MTTSSNPEQGAPVLEVPPSAGAPEVATAPLPEEIQAALSDLESQAADNAPAGEAPPAIVVTIDIKPVIANVWKNIFGVISVRAGDTWQLSEKEATLLASATEPVIDRYLPSFMRSCPELMGLAVALCLVALPRLSPEPSKQ